MERVTTKEAAKLLNMDVVTLQFLMRQDRLPIGYAIKKDGKSRYHYGPMSILWTQKVELFYAA